MRVRQLAPEMPSTPVFRVFAGHHRSTCAGSEQHTTILSAVRSGGGFHHEAVTAPELEAAAGSACPLACASVPPTPFSPGSGALELLAAPPPAASCALRLAASASSCAQPALLRVTSVFRSRVRVQGEGQGQGQGHGQLFPHGHMRGSTCLYGPSTTIQRKAGQRARWPRSTAAEALRLCDQH